MSGVKVCNTGRFVARCFGEIILHVDRLVPSVVQWLPHPRGLVSICLSRVICLRSLTSSEAYRFRVKGYSLRFEYSPGHRYQIAFHVHVIWGSGG